MKSNCKTFYYHTKSGKFCIFDHWEIYQDNIPKMVLLSPCHGITLGRIDRLTDSRAGNITVFDSSFFKNMIIDFPQRHSFKVVLDDRWNPGCEILFSGANKVTVRFMEAEESKTNSNAFEGYKLLQGVVLWMIWCSVFKTIQKTIIWFPACGYPYIWIC